jgi:hypothetical integral membrane protein (TIGR02206 family)
LRQFSTPHLAALAVGLVLCVLAIWLPRRHGGRWEAPAARALALLVLCAWAGEYVVDACEGVWSVRYTLPLQLTDAISIATVLALWTRRQLLVELVYFLALSASLQATVTPDLAHDFPSVFYFTYFVYHLGAIVAACYLVFGAGLLPRRSSVWMAFAVAWAWAGIAAIGCLATGGNYMFLREKPEQGSLLNAMGPWPWYILAASLVGLAMMLVLRELASRLGRERALPAPERLHGDGQSLALPSGVGGA